MFLRILSRAALFIVNVRSGKSSSIESIANCYPPIAIGYGVGFERRKTIVRRFGFP